jgi:hypothetical protein
MRNSGGINSDRCHKGVKQDLEHIFIRFCKVLSKDHGAFRAFMARLSDAFFIPSQTDIIFIKKALEKTKDEIKAAPWRYFKQRVHGGTLRGRKC